MNPPSPPDIEQVVTLVGTIFASISLGVGLVLLFVGVKLIRAIYTVAFTFVGAAAGLVVGHLYFPQFMWVAGVAGAVIVGMVGFLFYRIWIMLTFGAVLAVIGGSSWYLATSQGELASLWTQGESLTRDYAEVAGATVEMQRKLLELKMQPPDQGQMTESKKSQLENMDKASGALAQLSEKLEANPSPDEAARLLADAVDKIKAAGLGEQAEYLRFAQAAAKMQSLPRRQQELRDEAGRMLPAQALGASIAAAVGLTLGLIIAGASWRFAAVVMTATVGVKWTMLGIYVLIALHRPAMFDRYPFFGLQGLLLPGGLLLMGLAVQGLLARSAARAAKAAAERKQAAGQPAPPAKPGEPAVIPLAEPPVPPRKIEYSGTDAAYEQAKTAPPPKSPPATDAPPTQPADAGPVPPGGPAPQAEATPPQPEHKDASPDEQRSK